MAEQQECTNPACMARWDFEGRCMCGRKVPRAAGFCPVSRDRKGNPILDENGQETGGCDRQWSPEPFTCKRCGAATRPLDFDELVDQKPVDIAPELIPVEAGFDQLGKDETGTPLFSEVCLWLERHGIVDAGEFMLWHDLWLTIAAERESCKAEMFGDEKPSEDGGDDGG